MGGFEEACIESWLYGVGGKRLGLILIPSGEVCFQLKVQVHGM